VTSRSDFARRQRIKPSRSGVEMTSPDWRKTRLPASASDCCFCTVEDRSNLEPGDCHAVAVQQGKIVTLRQQKSCRHLFGRSRNYQMHKLICS